MNYIEFDYCDYKDPNEALIRDRDWFKDLCDEMTDEVMKYKERIDIMKKKI